MSEPAWFGAQSFKSAAGKFEWRDRGLKAIVAKLAGAGNSRLEVGLVGAEAMRPYPGSKGRVTVGEIGLINEFGTKNGHIPSRSFLRWTLIHRRDQIAKWLQEAAALDIKRGDHATFDDALHHVGERVVNLIKERIMSHPSPANAPLTIKRKGFDASLTDMLFLVNSIAHRVVRKLLVEGAQSATVTTEGSQVAANAGKRGKFSIGALRGLVGDAAIKAIGLK